MPLDLNAICGIEQILEELSATCGSGSFVYSAARDSFRIVAFGEFRGKEQSHGVYIVRTLLDSRIIYIGKAGTVQRDGDYKAQGLLRRITNVREGNVPANVWFAGVAEVHGDLSIQYVVLSSSSLAPAFVEALLLQSHLNDYGYLPVLNKSF